MALCVRLNRHSLPLGSEQNDTERIIYHTQKADATLPDEEVAEGAPPSGDLNDTQQLPTNCAQFSYPSTYVYD